MKFTQRRIPSLLLLLLLLSIVIPFRFNLLGAFQTNLALVHFAKAAIQPVTAPSHLDEAEQLLQAAISHPQNSSHAEEKLGFILLQQGDEVGAIQTWQTASLDVEQLIAFGQGAEKQRLTAEAGKWYRLAMEVEFANGADAFATWLYQQRRFEEARDVWQHALEAHTIHSLRLAWSRGLAKSLVALEQWPTAVQIIRQRLNEFPYDAPLLVELGKSLYRVGDVEAGIAAIEQAIAADDKYAQAYAELAAIQAETGNYDSAFDLYAKANQLRGESGVKWWRVAQANAARDAGQISQALDLYQQVVNRYPGYAPAYFESAWAYYLHDDWRQASQAIENAIASTKRPSANYYIRAGQIYEQAREVDKAILAYQEAAKLTPNDQRIEEGLLRLQQ